MLEIWTAFEKLHFAWISVKISLGVGIHVARQIPRKPKLVTLRMYLIFSIFIPMKFC